MSGLGECGDADLVRLAQAGEREAFAELYRRHYPVVVATCARRRSVDAEEVAQAAFVRAFERIDRCQGEARFGAWVQVIARHVSIDAARARSRALETPVVAALSASVADWPEEHALRQERVEALRSVLGRLPRRQREVLYARHVEGRRPPEIAAALGLSLGAVDSLLLRARRAAAAGYRTMAAEGGIAQTASTAAVAVAGSGVVSGPARLARAVTRGFDAVVGVMSRLGGRAGLPAAVDLVAGAAVVLALSGPGTPGQHNIPAGAARPAGASASPARETAPPGPAAGLAPVPEAGLNPPAPPAPPAPPSAPEAQVPQATVPPPPAGPNPVGRILSLVDVKATFTGIVLPLTPEPLPERPGRYAWDESRQRAEALWEEGRQQGEERWSRLRGR